MMSCKRSIKANHSLDDYSARDLLFQLSQCDDQLYKSTLQPLWATIPANSWDRGSHSVNCSLMFNDNGHLGTLAGSVKGQFTINGQPPAERPDRAPIVNPEALQSVQPKPVWSKVRLGNATPVYWPKM